MSFKYPIKTGSYNDNRLHLGWCGLLEMFQALLPLWF